MPRVIHPAKGVPIHVWARVLPRGALEQLEQLAAQPFVVEHVAAMPDLHVSEGVAVGSVFATVDTIVPSALGGDLGCGMSAVRFDFPAARLGPQQLRQWLEHVTREIPVGDQCNSLSLRNRGAGWGEGRLSTGSLEHARERLVPKHLGTLGGGNHFIELDRDGGGDLWLLVHSGSRGLGSAIAAHHLKAAGEAGFLRADTEAGRACLEDLESAFAFARANREALVRRAAQFVTELTGVEPSPQLDVHHNLVRAEEHFGRRLLVHRKGAISAEAGERALIPGSMGTASYIVEGLGAPTAFRSASHGAGRVMTRREARQLQPERFVQSMRRVVFDSRRRGLIEEAPAAYRDIVEVLEDEVDLVAPRVRLEPIAVLKGS